MKKKSTKREKIAGALKACSKNGSLNPEAVVEAARDPGSPLHDQFEWDNAKAAHAYRLETAKALIRDFQVEITHYDVTFKVPSYVSNPKKDGTYIETMKVAKKHEVAEKVLSDELARIIGAVRRAQSLAAAFNLTSSFDRMLDIALETEKSLAEWAESAGEEAPTAPV